MAVEHHTPFPPLESSTSNWRLIPRAIGVASDPRALTLATLGILALQAGAMVIESGFGPVERPPSRFERAGSSLAVQSAFFSGLIGAIFGVIEPFAAFFRADLRLIDRMHVGLVAFWTLVVWCLVGAAIARIAVVRVATGARVSVLSALKFSVTRMGTLLAAAAAPITVAWLIGLAGALVGLLDRIMPAAATLLAFVPLIFGLMNAVILLGLIGAWPLMVATIAAEGEDFFDAISRSYSYVNQQTVRYASYAVFALVLGGLGLIVVNLFVTTALGLADWSISLGAPRNEGFRFLTPDSVDASGLPNVARFWNGLVAMIVSAWTSSYLFASASTIYLVLRREVDGKAPHAIYHPKLKVATVVVEAPVSQANSTV